MSRVNCISPQNSFIWLTTSSTNNIEFSKTSITRSVILQGGTHLFYEDLWTSFMWSFFFGSFCLWRKEKLFIPREKEGVPPLVNSTTKHLPESHLFSTNPHDTYFQERVCCRDTSSTRLPSGRTPLLTSCLTLLSRTHITTRLYCVRL